jgi:[CysO sulfur-carrier protein]-S-L-cysteine hydrolase
VVSEDRRAGRGPESPTPDEWRAAAEAADGTRLWATAADGATLPAELLQQMIDAARADVPNETVGLLVAQAYAAHGGVPTRYVRMRNAAASPYRYLLDADEQLRVMLEIDDADEVIWGIVHSHVASPARPSPTDLGLAFYPDSLYLICSLASGPPEVRAWRISEREVLEVPLAIS